MTRLEMLQQLRDQQAGVLAEGVGARDLATLSREYRATLAEIDELTPKEKAGDPVDEITARRARRSSTA